MLRLLWGGSSGTLENRNILLTALHRNMVLLSMTCHEDSVTSISYTIAHTCGLLQPKNKPKKKRASHIQTRLPKCLAARSNMTPGCRCPHGGTYSAPRPNRSQTDSSQIISALEFPKVQDLAQTLQAGVRVARMGLLGMLRLLLGSGEL